MFRLLIEIKMEVSYRSRPYKISKTDKEFKGIVAANLSDLKVKAIHSLGLDVDSDEVDIFLAEDDTLVDNQEYFATIPENTKLIIKANEEKDQVDGLEVSESQEIEHSTYSLSEGIRLKMSNFRSSHCIVALLRLSDEELEEIANSSFETLERDLSLDEDVARVCIDSAGKELLRRRELSDATELLSMYHKAKMRSDGVDGSKRKKPSN